jgi:hypothetical protein
VLALGAALGRDARLDEVGFVALGGAEASAAGAGRALGWSVSACGCKLAVDVAALGELYRGARAVLGRARGGGRADEADGASKVALLLNADYESLWNRRKELVATGAAAGDADTLAREAWFTGLVLSKHFKSAPTWAHRAWLLRRRLERCEGDTVAAARLIAAERDVCERVAAAYPRCYNAWSHRATLCAHMDAAALVDELGAMRRWVRWHVSDFSAMAQAQLTLRRLAQLEDEDTASHRLAGELHFYQALAATYPGHDALWRHLQSLLHALVAALSAPGLRAAARTAAWAATRLWDPRERGRRDALLIATTGLDLEAVARDPRTGLVMSAQVCDGGPLALLPRALSDALCLAVACALEEGCARPAMQQRGALGLLLFAGRAVLLHLDALPGRFAQTLGRLRFAQPGPAPPRDRWALTCDEWRAAVDDMLNALTAL